MGLDEALLEAPAPDPDEGAEAGAPPVTVRFYSWSPDTLSLGYFQRLVDVPPAAAFLGIEAPGVGPDTPLPSVVVRRLTGGGAIHHQGELTFSITTSLEHPLYRGHVEGSYERVHAAIASALAEAGVMSSPRAERTPASEAEGTGMCFHHSSPVDLIWNERKGVGSAQRRKGGRVLHHGSIKLSTTELETGVATVAGFASPGALAPLLRAAFERHFDVRLEPSVPTAAELEHAKAREAFFGSDEFLRRR